MTGRTFIATVVASVFALAQFAPATAAPMMPAPAIASGDSGLVVKIDDRRDYYKRYCYNCPGRSLGGGKYAPSKPQLYRRLPFGVYVGPIIVIPAYRLTAAHYRWCYWTYKSYRRWDNSFKPYHGPRRQCLSPYIR